MVPASGGCCFLFAHVLAWLRDPSSPLPSSRHGRLAALEEAQFYGLQGLADAPSRELVTDSQLYGLSRLERPYKKDAGHVIGVLRNSAMYPPELASSYARFFASVPPSQLVVTRSTTTTDAQPLSVGALVLRVGPGARSKMRFRPRRRPLPLPTLGRAKLRPSTCRLAVLQRRKEAGARKYGLSRGEAERARQRRKKSRRLLKQLRMMLYVGVLEHVLCRHVW